LILLNAIFIGMEVDSSLQTHGRLSSVWRTGEIVFVFLFTMELVVRIRADGIKECFMDPWNCADASLLVLAGASMMVDTINLSILRMVRILRLARIVRLFRFLRPLYLLLHGCMESMRTLVWFVMITLIVIYCFAVAAASMFGGAKGFTSLPETMFSLFTVFTLEGWLDLYHSCQDIVGPEYRGYVWMFFLSYIFFVSVLLKNLLTGVVVEHVLSVAHIYEADRAKGCNQNYMAHYNQVRHIVEIVDQDRNGFVSEKELLNGLQDHHLVKKMRKSGILLGTDMDHVDVVLSLFRKADLHDAGRITVSQAVEMFMRCTNQSVSQQNLFEVEKGLKRDMLAQRQQISDDMAELKATMHKVLLTVAGEKEDTQPTLPEGISLADRIATVSAELQHLLAMQTNEVLSTDGMLSDKDVSLQSEGISPAFFSEMGVTVAEYESASRDEKARLQADFEERCGIDPQLARRTKSPISRCVTLAQRTSDDPAALRQEMRARSIAHHRRVMSPGPTAAGPWQALSQSRESAWTDMAEGRGHASSAEWQDPAEPAAKLGDAGGAQSPEVGRLPMPPRDGDVHVNGSATDSARRSSQGDLPDGLPRAWSRSSEHRARDSMHRLASQDKPGRPPFQLPPRRSASGRPRRQSGGSSTGSVSGQDAGGPGTSSSADARDGVARQEDAMDQPQKVPRPSNRSLLQQV